MIRSGLMIFILISLGIPAFCLVPNSIDRRVDRTVLILQQNNAFELLVSLLF